MIGARASDWPGATMPLSVIPTAWPATVAPEIVRFDTDAVGLSFWMLAVTSEVIWLMPHAARPGGGGR